VGKYGLRVSEISSLPQNEYDHMDHHMPVQREGETKEQCIERFLKSHLEALDCKECREVGAEWVPALD